MNVFYLDKDPKVAASMHIWHKHVVKMILEYAQLLSTCHQVYSESEEPLEGFYRKTHVNHPSAVWVRESQDHYLWVYNCMLALGDIYKKKTGKTHLTITKMKKILSKPPTNLINTGFKQPPQCMPPEYHDNDSVKAYNKYYEFKRELLV